MLTAIMTKAIVLALALAATPALAGENPLYDARNFDWDRYHARQDACVTKDRIIAACARGFCYDLLLMRLATRHCSPWRPLGERR